MAQTVLWQWSTPARPARPRDVLPVHCASAAGTRCRRSGTARSRTGALWTSSTGWRHFRSTLCICRDRGANCLPPAASQGNRRRQTSPSQPVISIQLLVIIVKQNLVGIDAVVSARTLSFCRVGIQMTRHRAHYVKYITYRNAATEPRPYVI